MNEAYIRTQIKKFVEDHGGRCEVRHGSIVSEGGQPDLDGVVRVIYDGLTFQVPFKVEIKQPGEEPRLRQNLRMKEWSQFSIYCVGWVTSVKEFQQLLIEYVEDRLLEGYVAPHVTAKGWHYER